MIQENNELPTASTRTTPVPPWLKLLLDLGPLAVFFVCFRVFGLMPATASIIAATLLSVAVGYAYERKLAPMPIIMAVAVSVFGGLTLILHNEQFIKMKPTVVNLLFASVLLIGNAAGRPMLKYLLGAAMQLEEAGWKKLSFRWGLFFIFLAGLNEAIWRNFPTDFWVNFKVFGMFTLTLLFTLAQLPLMKRYLIHLGHEPEEK